jgi:hypothetical protein
VYNGAGRDGQNGNPRYFRVFTYLPPQMSEGLTIVSDIMPDAGLHFRSCAMKIRIALVVAATTLSGVTARAQTQQEAAQFARDGRTLSPQQVSDLEDGLKANPDDLDARTRLLGYYFSSSLRIAGADATRGARRRHILWIIEHHPEAEVTRLSEMTIDPAGHALADPDAYNEARQLWLRQVDLHKSNAQVLVHAARFFRLSDKAISLSSLKKAFQLTPNNEEVASELGYTYAITALGITMINNNGLPVGADPAQAASQIAKTAIDELRASPNPVVIAVAGNILFRYGAMIQAVIKGAINQDALAEELLLRSEALDPGSPGPPRSLSELYSLRMMRAGVTNEDRTTLARKRLAQAELVVDRTTNNRESQLDALITASKAALDANAFDKALGFATDLLKQVTDPPSVRDGQAFHDGHVALGRVALKDGDVEQAKAHLLRAGRTPGGGTLTSFGPNMSLAKELAEHGERDTVVTYLELCRAFWHGRQLNQWIQTLKGGAIPEFGANLIY